MINDVLKIYNPLNSDAHAFDVCFLISFNVDIANVLFSIYQCDVFMSFYHVMNGVAVA